MREELSWSQSETRGESEVAFHMTYVKNNIGAMSLWVVPGPVEEHLG